MFLMDEDIRVEDSRGADRVKIRKSGRAAGRGHAERQGTPIQAHKTSVEEVLYSSGMSDQDILNRLATEFPVSWGWLPSKVPRSPV